MRETMLRNLEVMRKSIETGLNPDLKSASGIVGGNAHKMRTAIDDGIIEDSLINKAAVYALAVAETNACMGRICAAPTAGACGILPGVLIAAAEYKCFDDDKIIDALFVAGDIGLRIAQKATLSGAAGGCQAECGAAAAMAAGSLVSMLGGETDTIDDAVAIALKSIMGLVCDPVAGLVEVPCVKRNANCSSIAITSANMALAGIKSVIPADEVIVAMGDVGKSMPPELRETSRGGLAVTPSAIRIGKVK